jgi:hypothetical protein
MGLSIFDGMGGIVDRFLNDPSRDLDGPKLTKALLERMTDNWKACPTRAPSDQNWRFNKQPKISERNTSKEKILEKRVAKVTGDDWANQIPTASGLLDPYSRHCNVDLAERQCTEYSLLELKWESNNPLYAAIEILRYGLVYLFSRLNRDKLGYNGKKLLAASAIHLRVLAPREYYAENGQNVQLRWLERALSEGVAAAANGQLKMDFRFEAFPPDFKLRAFSADGRLNLTDAELLTALNGRARMFNVEESP